MFSRAMKKESEDFHLLIRPKKEIISMREIICMCLKNTQSSMEATMETMDFFFQVSSVIGKAGECHQGREKGKESRRKELQKFKDRDK